MIEPPIEQFHAYGEITQIFGWLDGSVKAPREAIAEGSAGTGKAQPLTATVQTPGGPVLMGELRVGDAVCTPTGRARVKAIFPQGEQDVYRVMFNDGASTECTSDHLWAVRWLGGSCKGGKKVREMRDVRRLSDLAIRKRAHFWVDRATAEYDYRQVAIPPYVLGVLLGDGYLRQSCMEFTSADPEIAARVSAMLPSEYALRSFQEPSKARLYRIGWAKRGKVVRRKAPSGSVRQWPSDGRWIATRAGEYLGTHDTREDAQRALDEAPRCEREHSWWAEIERLGLMGHRAHEKFIPDDYLYGSEEQRLEIVRGLMDTDGTVDRVSGTASLSTSSMRMAEQFSGLIESLGGMCTVTLKKTTHRVNYRCWIRDEAPARFFRLERKRALCRERVIPLRRYIRSVEKIGRALCQCISVDDAHGLYLTDRCIVTHNTRPIGEWIKAVCNTWPDSKGLVLRDTRVSLNESFLDIWENQVLGPNHPAVLGGPTRAHRQSYKHPTLGGEVILGGMDNPTKIFSTEYSWIYFNECQQTTKQKWESLHRALRRNSSMPFRILLGDCNPEDEFHWANQRMNDGVCHRILTRLWDNPRYYDHENNCWTPDGIDYAGRLRENLSGVLLERLYHGRWVSAHGQVWPEYDPRIHCLDAELREDDGKFLLDVDGWDAPVELVYFLGAQDIGFSAPGCAQVWGCDHEGRMYRVAEIYQTGKDHDWWGQRWVEFHDEFPIRTIVCDHDMAFIASLNRRIRGRGEDGAPGIARPASKGRGKGEEKVGIDDVRVRMKAREDGTRGLYLVKGSLRYGRDPYLSSNSLPTCLEQEIPSYVYPEREDGKINRDEPDPTCADHAADTCRYAARFLKDRSFGIKDERRIFKRGSLNDRLGYNEFFRRNGFRFDRRAQ